MSPDNEGTIASLDDDEVQELTPLEIYSTLLVKQELLLTIMPEQEKELRTGLIQVKAKENARLKEQMLPIDHTTLTFNSYPSKEVEGAQVVHVSLQKRRTIAILAIKEPEKDI